MFTSVNQLQHWSVYSDSGWVPSVRTLYNGGMGKIASSTSSVFFFFLITWLAYEKNSNKIKPSMASFWPTWWNIFYHTEPFLQHFLFYSNNTHFLIVWSHLYIFHLSLLFLTGVKGISLLFSYEQFKDSCNGFTSTWSQGFGIDSWAIITNEWMGEPLQLSVCILTLEGFSTIGIQWSLLEHSAMMEQKYPTSWLYRSWSSDQNLDT